MIKVEITGSSYAEIEAQLMGFLANPSATIEPDQMGFTLAEQELTKADLDRPFEDEHAVKQAAKQPEPALASETTYTLEKVRAAAMAKLDGKQFKALLEQLGAQHFTTLDSAKYGELMELISHA